jgi:hypothetical protein
MLRAIQVCTVLCFCAATAQGQLVSESKARQLRRFFPKVDDPQTQAVLDDPQLLLYTNAEMPRAYQFWDGAFPGIHSAGYNISSGAAEQAKGHGRGGNGNVEFPWSSAGGTHRCDSLYVVRFLHLPEQDGRRLPVAWYGSNLRGGGGGYAWVFPSGTVFGEILALRGPGGVYYTFELRTRRKHENEWIPNAFRPFPTAESLAERIQTLRPDWDGQPNLKRVVDHLLQPKPTLHVARLASSHPLRREFDQTAAVDDLPGLEDDRLVAELLTTSVFRSAEGELWRATAGHRQVYAPTTKAPFHIVPRNYDAGYIAIDQQSCARCHSSVNRHVNDFDTARDWYGRVRGSDQIFSFHPFEPQSISYNGFAQSVSMRSSLVSAGLLEQFDPQRHPATYYRRSRVE